MKKIFNLVLLNNLFIQQDHLLLRSVNNQILDIQEIIKLIIMLKYKVYQELQASDCL